MADARAIVGGLLNILGGLGQAAAPLVADGPARIALGTVARLTSLAGEYVSRGLEPDQVIEVMGGALEEYAKARAELLAEVDRLAPTEPKP
jgi:hypothetical protein